MPSQTESRTVPRTSPRKGIHATLAVCLLWTVLGPLPIRGVSRAGKPGGAGLLYEAGNPTGRQEAPSFYLRLFESGEKAFGEKRYREATEDLEIAVFGLSKDRVLAGKAQIYLAVCFSYLAMRPKIEPALMQATRLLEPGELEGFGFGEEILAPLRKLARDFRVGLEIPPPPGSAPVEEKAVAPPPVSSPQPEKTPPVVPDLVFVKKIEGNPSTKATPPPAKKPGKNDLVDIKPLEKRLKSEPGNAALVKELAALHLRRGDPKKARAVLEKYLEIRPKDLDALFSLAKVGYFLKEYKTAMDGFQTVSAPAAEAALDRETNLKVAMYKALCLFALGQEGSVASYINFVEAAAGPDGLAGLLEEEDLSAPWELMLYRLKR